MKTSLLKLLGISTLVFIFTICVNLIFLPPPSKSPLLIGSAPEEKYNFSLPTKAHVKPDKIPDDIANGTETFLYFFGPARSGTTFVNDAINSHPHVLMAHEMGLLKELIDNRSAQFAKAEILHAVWKQQKNITRDAESFRGFTTGYLNAWEDQIKVIGDKRAQLAVVVYGSSKTRFINMQKKLRNTFNNSIVAVRDPYNTLLRQCKIALESSPRKMYGILNNKTLDVIPGDLKARMRDYKKWMTSVDEIMRNDLFDVKLIHLEEIFKDPELTVREWCRWLKIECFSGYISLIKNTTKSSGNSDKFYWPRESIETINKFIENNPHLYLDGGKSFKINADYFFGTVPIK